MNYLFLLTSVFIGTGKNIVMRLGKDRFKGSFQTHFMNFLTALICIAIVLISSGGNVNLCPQTVFYGCFYAFFTITAQLSYLRAVSLGSTALSSLIYSMGFLLTVVVGFAFFKEKINLPIILAIVIIIVSLLLCVQSSEGQKTSAKWIFFCFGGFFSSGIVGVIQKLFRASAVGEDLDSLLAVSFAFMAIFSGLMMLISKKTVCTEQIKGKFFLLAVLLGLCIGFANKLNLFLSGALPSVVFFPTLNVGTISLTAIASLVVFKEKLSRRKIVSIILGLVGIVLVGIFK